MVFRLRAFNVHIPLLVPFKTSFGTTITRDALLFELSDGETTAYSESVTSTIPDYGYEDNTTVLHIVKNYLAGELRDAPTPEDFMNRVSVIKGHNMAKASMEMLLWDYHSKQAGKPLHEYLGPSKGYADAGVSIGMSSIQNMIDLVSAALERKYKRIKVKIEKGRELEILGSIRDHFPDIPLSADANCGYSIKDIELLKKIDTFNLEYLEQPLGHDDLVNHAKLASEMNTPICLDESIKSAENAEDALDNSSCTIINIKPGRVGGLLESLKIARIARGKSSHVWVGGMLETGIGRAFNVSMASNVLVDFPGDTSPNDRYFKADIVKNPFAMDSGTIIPNAGPGIGVEVDLEQLHSRVQSVNTIL